MSKNKKVLIITYYWPPAGGPGVQRWLKFAKYLPEYGISPIIYCPENPTYPIRDESLLKEVPSNITVLKQPISEPYSLAKIFSSKKTKQISSGIIPNKRKQNLIDRSLLFIRGNFFIPDARKNWINPSVEFLKDYIQNNDIKVVVTTGPPHSLHLIGLELQSLCKVNWVADFRDPWTTIGYHKKLKLTEKARQKHNRLEKDVLNKADSIIVTSFHTKREFEGKTKQPITVITNGFDEYDITVESKDSKFSISHVGSLLSERNPKVLWEVLSDLKASNSEFANSLQINLIGVVSDEVVSSIAGHELNDYLDIKGYVSHDMALTYQLKTQLLLLIEIDSADTRAIIPGKLYEYLKSGTPILALGPKDSDIPKILNDTKAGYYFNYQEKEALRLKIENLFHLYQRNELSSKSRDIERFSRRNLTGTLADIIKAYL